MNNQKDIDYISLLDTLIFNEDTLGPYLAINIVMDMNKHHDLGDEELKALREVMHIVDCFLRENYNSNIEFLSDMVELIKDGVFDKASIIEILNSQTDDMNKFRAVAARRMKNEALGKLIKSENTLINNN